MTVLSRAASEAALVAAAGMLAPNAESFPVGPLADLARISREMYPDYVAMVERVSGVDVGYVSRGDVLFPLLAGEDAPAGVRGGVYVPKAQLGAVEAALGESVEGAYLVPGDGNVDNRKLGVALRAACEKLGVDVREGEDVVRIVAEGGDVVGVVLASGEVVRGAHFVAASGAWTQALLPNVPMRPVKGQMICLEPRGAGERLRHMLYGHGIYIVPKDGGKEIYVGATVEDKGFDVEATVGGVSELMAKALALVPEFADYRVKESWAGLRPATPDLMPVLGLAGYGNMSVASGYFRNGVLLMPAAAAMACAVALGTEAKLEPELRRLLGELSCSRFVGGSPASDASRVVALKDAGLGLGVDDEEILVYKIGKDGTRVPIRRGETPSNFTQGAGDIAGEEEAIRAKMDVPSTGVQPKPVLDGQRSVQKVSTDAYDDIMEQRGAGAAQKMSDSLAKNRSFGVTARPGHEGEASSLNPEEWEALDAAFAEGKKAISLVPDFEKADLPVKSSPDAEMAEGKEKDGEVLVYQVLEDGTHLPIRRGETPGIFTQGAGDIAGEEEAIRAKMGNPASVSKSMAGVAAGSKKVSTDAYDDILEQRGEGAERKMSDSLRKNRSFGVTPRPGHENESSSISPEEWDALDIAFAEGKSLISTVPDVDVAAGDESDSSSVSAEDRIERSSTGKGLNGFRVSNLFGRGSARSE